MKVTERDLRLLTWIGEQFIVNVRELADVIELDRQKYGLPPIGRHFLRDTIHNGKVKALMALQTHRKP